MLRLIDQFLEEEGMGATRQILAEEWTGKARERDEAEGDARKLKKAILGESTINKDLSQPVPHTYSLFFP